MSAAVVRRVVRPVLGLLAALAFLLASAAAGSASGPGAAIGHVEVTDDGVQILVSLSAGADVDLTQVGVTIDGQAAEASAEAAGSSAVVRRTTVLAIDTSNSMSGARIAAAKQAARQFIDTVPDDVYVGVVGFAAGVDTLLAPTQDRDQARSVVDGLSLSRETRLYDGVVAAVDMAGDSGQRSLLVLSDGADTSRTALSAATDAIKAAEVLVDVVSLDQSDAAVSALTGLADAGDGRVIPADNAALVAAFSGEAAALARQVLVTSQVPASVTAEDATVSVSLPGAAGVLTAQAFVPVRAAAPSVTRPVDNAVAATSSTVPGWTMWAGIGTLGMGAIALAMLLVPAGTTVITPAERVSTYTAKTSRRAAPETQGFDSDQALATAKGAAAQVLRRNKGLEARIAHRLEGAGSELRSAEWLLLHGAIFFVAGLVGLVLGRGNLIVGLIFLSLGAFGPWFYLGFRRSRRRKAFNHSLPDTLQLMSGSLTAGLSLAQSVDTIVREGADPIAAEFRRVMVETRLGVSLEDAMEGVGERFESRDFEWVVMAIRIQRQVGGNLAELLNTVAATMREREYIRRQVAALAAEGKLSAWVLGLLPPLFMVYLLLANHDYVIVMFQEPIGWVMLAGAALILSVGVFWMSRLIKVEV